MINIFHLFNLFSKKGKTVIHFTTHGCMGNIHEFNYIGVITGITYPRLCNGSMFYKIKVLKNKESELRDDLSNVKYEKINHSSLQKLGGDFYIAYD